MRSGFYLGLTVPLLLAMAVNAYGLTTFGKSQNTNVNQQSNPPQPVQRGRECQFEKDCAAIVNTSCVPDPQDAKSRCLCGDNKAPVNGVCKSKFKGLNHVCMANEECIEGSECMNYKESGNRGVAKVCKCSEGYTEQDYSCSGGVKLANLSLSMVTMIAVWLALLVGIGTGIPSAPNY